MSQNNSIEEAQKIAAFLKSGKAYSFEEHQGYSFSLYFRDGHYYRDYYDMMNYDGKPSSSEKFSPETFTAMLCQKPKSWFRSILEA